LVAVYATEVEHALFPTLEDVYPDLAGVPIPASYQAFVSPLLVPWTFGRFIGPLLVDVALALLGRAGVSLGKLSIAALRRIDRVSRVLDRRCGASLENLSSRRFQRSARCRPPAYRTPYRRPPVRRTKPCGGRFLPIAW
jgi:hypothetical protein